MAVIHDIITMQNRAIYDNLRLGDMVELFDSKELAIVVNKTYPWVVCLVVQGNSYLLTSLTDLHNLTKIKLWDRPRGFKLSELTHVFKERLKWANTWHSNKIDNLSYIEILARLREYELQG